MSYYPTSFLHDRQLDYTLSVPGKVVETNGQLLADDQVRWRFAAIEAYPLGYEMSCRSLEGQTRVQKDLLQEERLGTRATMLAYVALVGNNPKMLEVLRECRRQ